MSIKRTLEVCDMNEKEKQKFTEMSGKMMLWMCEKRSIRYMSDKLNLHPDQIEHNIDEMLYTLYKQVGIKRFIKTLFIK